MFSQYSSTKFCYERVNIIYPDGKKDIQPKMETRKMVVDFKKVSVVTGVQENKDQLIDLLSRMGLESAYGKKKNSPKLNVIIPPTRHDILHEVDIFEDVAIAYGYNNIKKTFPKTATVAQEFALNKLSDQLREEISRCGFTEALTFSLASVSLYIYIFFFKSVYQSLP